MENGRLELRDWQDALNVQNACNLSGVVHAWSRVMTRIFAEGVGTQWRNVHPINILYACKVADLTGQTVDGSIFGRAYEYVNAVVAEPFRKEAGKFESLFTL